MRKIAVTILITIVLLATVILSSKNCPADQLKFHVNIGFSSRAFVNVPKEDIRVAARILSEKLARKTVGSAESRIYDSASEIMQAIKARKLDAVALTPEDFFVIGNRIPLDPVMITATEKGYEVELLLLVRKGSRIRDVRGLRKRTLSIPARILQYGNMYSTWVETLVMRQGARDPSAFFSAVREVPNPAQAIMQVFFRQADACVVTAQTFGLATELNPQIGRELTAIARVEKLAGGIVAFRSDLPEDRKQQLRSSLLTIHEDPEGRQLFVLFQLNRLIPYRPEYMKATEAFFAEHRNRRAQSDLKH